jgi:hypothetical protein
MLIHHTKVDGFHCLVIAVGQRKQRVDLEVKWENSYFGFCDILLVFIIYFSVQSSNSSRVTCEREGNMICKGYVVGFCIFLAPS